MKAGILIAVALARLAHALTTVHVWKEESKMTGPMNSIMNAIARHNLSIEMDDMARRDIALANFNDELYTTSATLGGQTFTFDLDTGSSDVWVRGANCKSNDGSCGVAGQDAFNTGATTATAAGTTWITQYGSGAVTGNVYNGMAVLAGIGTTINFGVSTQEVGFNSPGAGLWGLAFPTINNIDGGNYVQNAGIKSMGFYFSNWVNGDAGILTMNGVDASKFSGTINYIPISSDTYYQFNPAGATFTVNGVSTALTNTANGAIADTGTTLLLIPAAIAATLNKAIGATQVSNSIYSIPCSVANTGPAVTFALDTVSIDINPSEYVIAAGDGTCFSGIASIGQIGQGPAYIFGDTFLRAAYSVFDIANNRLGFAQAVHPTAIVNDITAPFTALVAATATAAGNAAAAATTTTTTTTTAAAAAAATKTTKTTTTAAAAAAAANAGSSTCSHSLCKVGAALVATCSDCAATVCATDSYCCTTKWDAKCVKEARQICGTCAKN